MFTIIKNKSFLFLALFTGLVTGLTSCGNAKSDCAIGEPRPMFAADLTGISDYNFTASKQESSETFLFHGETIEINQSGCNQIKQLFQFQIGKGKNPEELIDAVNNNLIAFAQLGQQQAGFLAWSQAINDFRSAIKISAPFSPARGIEITIDRIQQVDNDLLLLKLEMTQI